MKLDTTLVLIARNKQVTENSASPYVCRGCESVLENSYGNADKYDEFEACPMCMTTSEYWELKYGEKSKQGSD